MAKKRNPLLGQEIGQKIRALRLKRYPKHGGQKAAAEDFGVSYTLWSQWERGVKIPSDVNQQKLSDFFGISIANLRNENVKVYNTRFGTIIEGQIESGFILLIEMLEFLRTNYNDGKYSESAVTDLLKAVEMDIARFITSQDFHQYSNRKSD